MRKRETGQTKSPVFLFSCQIMILIDEELTLELLKPEHGPELFDAVESGRNSLRRFLPWVDATQSETDYIRYIQSCQQQHARSEGFNYVVIWKNRPVGAISLQQINQGNKAAAIGYWLTPFVQGQGLMSRAGAKLIEYSFQTLDLHRLEIRAALENKPSQAVAQRLGFQKEGVLRQSEYIREEYLDLIVYGLLKPEWQRDKETHT